MRGKVLSRIFIRRLLLLFIPLLILSSMPYITSSAILPTSGSSYETLGYVTYKIELTQVVHGNPATLKLYVPRWQNWSAEITGSAPTLQESFLQNASEGYSTAIFNQTDKFNNSLDYFQEDLTNGEEFSLSMNYTLTVKQVRWNNLGNPKMTDYDTGSAFYQLYTEDQPSFIQVSDPNIRGNASQICGTETNPVEKARKIFEWVSKNINYELQTGGSNSTGEKGASWALANLEGDCSEYSDLMVAMLRSEGVPARKVVGLAMLTDQGNELPSYSNGSSWYYMIDVTSGFKNITGHAWVEYYVPAAGWVSCDPTWGVNRTDNFYFNYQDYLHIASARGEDFGDEVVPAFPEIGEYPAIPYPLEPYGTLSYYHLTVRVTVLDNHEWIDATLLFWIVGVLLTISVIAITYWIVSTRKASREKSSPMV